MAGSSNVKVVNTINNFDVSNHKSVPIKGNPNSVTKVTKDNVMIQERYYDENGNVYLDIDYTDHLKPKHHPYVPHEHRWVYNENEELIRLPGEDPIK